MVLTIHSTPEENIEDWQRFATEFVQLLESGESAKWCKCIWNVHPEDVHVEPGTCRECNLPNKHAIHNGLPEDFEMEEAHRYKGIRRKLIDTNPFCPVHTREGLLVKFLDWLDGYDQG